MVTLCSYLSVEGKQGRDDFPALVKENNKAKSHGNSL